MKAGAISSEYSYRSNSAMIPPSDKAFMSVRISSVFFCNLVLHWLLLALFIVIVNLELFSAGMSFQYLISIHFSFRFWLYGLPLVIVTLAQGVVSCREYVLAPSYPSNRVSVLLGMVSVHNIVVCGLYAYIGLSVPLLYTSVEDNEFSSFTVACGSGHCLSEDRLFLILGGAGIGFYYFIHNHLFRTRFLEFPLIQQNKSVMIKSSIYPALKSSFRYSFVPVALYLVIYYFQGNYFRDLLIHLFGYEIYPGNLDSFINLLRFKRLAHFWAFSVTTIFTLKIMEIILKIYFMQRYEFAMYQSTSHHNQFVMEDALSRVDVPIIRHLAFWDLALLSENNVSRRKEIYTLSQPGGHPYTWRAIKKQCFNAIDNFTSSLELTVKKPSSLGPSNSPQSIRQQRYESINYFVSSKPDQPFFCTETFSSILRYLRAVLVDYIFSKLAYVGESRPVRFLFGDVPKLRVNHLVLHSLPVAWAAESLSFLLCASLTEDIYGVLQSDIPEVISTLLRLQAVLDSLQKNSTVLRKFHSLKSDPVAKMHNTLTSKVKRSLYHLAIHFRPFVADLQLPKNEEIRLLAYCCFKE